MKKGAVPLARRRITKDETLRLMKGTGVLCHVGAGITRCLVRTMILTLELCDTHIKALEAKRFDEIQFDEYVNINVTYYI